MTRPAPLTLAVAGLAAERGGRSVFADLSFAARGGEALGVVGRNGAGKSTLLRVLAGLLRPAAGRVALDPPDARDPDAPVGERAHYLGHLDALKPALTPLDHLEAAAALLGRGGGRGAPSGGPAPATPDEALDRVALGHAADLPCATLSAGQRRRVALARLLVAARPLWLLDEPSTALDLGSQAVLRGMMRDHLAAGGLIVAATHGPLGLDGTRELRLERRA
ncbi:heme ABC exporter ATP-binding protein CcmA [Lichenibacterium minor]|uniref:Heme ABC exporter ATP-binding protein CcmA n=1 Tax=Lichenibacterium minor TaxID=2316528 RepID=A0A4Q2U7J4_9HYPH|nr:heme ABC exporter ATP-binding protein CcmA [Lichenibacterium minor]RYC30845.1 heme ABC exporter ATP-binding protein CcmA [Lichenibacterium minor]